MIERKKNNYPKKIQDINAEHGLIPPQATELEEAVLGALMLEKEAIFEIFDFLKPESFYVDAHQKIYAAIVSLSEHHKPIDMLTVIEELKRREELDEIGGAYFISQLTTRVASSAHIEFHARIISQKFIQRELIRVSDEIRSKAFDPSIDVDDLLDFSERELFNIAYGQIKKESVPITELLKIAIQQIEDAAKREDGLSGIPSGFTALDRVTSGWHKSDLVIIAARPAMGKTAFVLSMARNMAVYHKIAIAFFSLEMSSIQLVTRLVVGETELPADKIKRGCLENWEWEQLDYKIKNLVDAPIYIDDTPALSIFEFRAKARRLKMKHDIKAIVIDYLQLMTGSGESRGSREQEVSQISRSLKAIAKELDLPIIALSQLNRSVEMRSGDKRPQLSDLRESGAIEQDADIVCFIHRPEKYGLTEDEEGNSTKGLAQLIIAKHRNGAVCDVSLRFVEELAKFTDFDSHGLEPIKKIELTGGSKAVTYGSSMNYEEESNKKEEPFFSKAGFKTEDAPF